MFPWGACSALICVWPTVFESSGSSLPPNKVAQMERINLINFGQDSSSSRCIFFRGLLKGYINGSISLTQVCSCKQKGQGKSLFPFLSVSLPLSLVSSCHPLSFSPSPPIPSPRLPMSHGIMATYTTGCFCRRKTLTVAEEKYSSHTFPWFAC